MKYWPEVVCLLVLLFGGLLTINSNNHSQVLNNQVDVKEDLHLSIIQYSIETVAIGYKNENHYDQHAQRTLKVDQLLERLGSADSKLKSEVQQFENRASNYIQLVTMLKTSKKLIASLPTKVSHAPKNIKHAINQVIATLNEIDVNNLLSIRNRLKRQIEEQANLFQELDKYELQWQMIQLHIDFILANSEFTASEVDIIKNSQISELIKASIDQTAANAAFTRYKITALIIICLISLFILLIILLRRQAIKLKLTLAEAQEASTVKSEFLASMSHEIRTPMNGILGMLNLLTKEPLSTKQFRYSQLAKSSANSLLVIINDILDVSKIEAGKLDIEVIDFDLHGLFRDFASSMALRVHELGLEFILDIGNVKQKMVKGDPGRIRQILINLVGNSIKFTKQGEVVVRASLREKAEDESYYQLDCSIIDTGIGIAPDNIDKLFDVFTQADSSTTREFGGTGLGLSIVKQLCELMGGSVSATSQLGKGSQFDFSVKLESSTKMIQSIPTIEMTDLPILIVDDNQTNIEVLSGLLELKNIQVTACLSGKECITLLNSKTDELGYCPYKIAILDMQMPEMDGAELAKHIRNNSKFDKMSLVMMTSMGEHGEVDSYLKAGFAAYFHKPTIAQDLYDAISLIIGDNQTPNSRPILTHDNISALRATDSNREDTFASSEKYRLLLADDSEINHIVALGILEEIGFNVDVAFDGEQAIESLRKQPEDNAYDLILMDCQMPNMDGYEATRNIRRGAAGENYKDITIVAMTANAMQGDREKCLNAGMNDYLTKPIDEDPLMDCLSQWLKMDKRPLDEKNPHTDSDLQNRSTEDENSIDIWDYAGLLARMKNKEKRVSKILKLFLMDTPERIENIEKYTLSQDNQSLVTEAHTLKGVFANINATTLQSLSAELEQMAKESDNKQLAKILPIFKNNYEKLLVELERVNHE